MNILQELVVKNPYQTKTLRVLCVCSVGVLRSPTMMNVFHQKYGWNTRSAGTSDYALIPVTKVLMEWANLVVAADLIVMNQLLEKFGKDYSHKTHCANIPDDYSWNSAELIELCENIKFEGINE